MNNKSPLKSIVAWLVAVAFLVENIDGSIINIAVPKIAEALHVHPLALKLAVTSYLLSIGVFIPISGWMADRFGTKNIFMAAFTIFGISSIAAGLSHNLTQLVIARIVQGFGGAMTIPVGRLIILRNFDKQDLMRIMNFILIPALLGPIIGPVLGGVIVTFSSWRWIFFINIPIVILEVLLIFVFMENQYAKAKAFDWLGFAFLGTGLACLSFGFSAMGQHALPALEYDTLLLVGVIAVLLYLVHQARTKNPVINPEIFKPRIFKIGISFGFMFRVGVGSLSFLLPLLFQIVFHKTPLVAAYYIIFITIGMISSRPLRTRVYRMAPMRVVIIANACWLACLFFMMSFVTAATPFWVVVLLLYAYGIFSSVQFAGLQVACYSDATPELMSQVTSLASAMQQIANSFAVAVAAFFLEYFSDATTVYHGLTLSAFHKTFVCVAIIFLLGSFGFAFLKRDAASHMTGYKSR